MRIDGTLTADKYSQILEHSLLPEAQTAFGSNWYLLHDNDPKHTSSLMQGPRRKLKDGRYLRLPGWFKLNRVKLLQIPAYSPDCNPIEHIWALIKTKLRGKRFKNVDDCWEGIKTIWMEEIKQESINHVIESMPARLNAIRRANGGCTKY